MAAADIDLSSADATPVVHTFEPRGPDKDGLFWFEDSSADEPIGYWRISVQLKRPPVAVAGMSADKRTYRAVIGLHEPVLEVVSNNTVSGIEPAPTVSYIPRAFAEFVIPERTSLIMRQNLRKMMYNLLNNAQVISLVESLQTPF